LKIYLEDNPEAKSFEEIKELIEEYKNA